MEREEWKRVGQQGGETEERKKRGKRRETEKEGESERQ